MGQAVDVHRLGRRAGRVRGAEGGEVRGADRDRVGAVVEGIDGRVERPGTDELRRARAGRVGDRAIGASVGDLRHRAGAGDFCGLRSGPRAGERSNLETDGRFAW